MRLKRLISQLLLVVYLSTIIGSAYVSLACHCSWAAADRNTHECTTTCAHKSAFNSSRSDIASKCPCSHHQLSDDIELYTASDSDRHYKSSIFTGLALIEASFELATPEAFCLGIQTPYIIHFKEPLTEILTLRGPPLMA